MPPSLFPLNTARRRERNGHTVDDLCPHSYISVYNTNVSCEASGQLHQMFTQERKGTEMQTWESTQGSQHSIEKQGPVDYLFPPSFLLQTLMM